MKTKNLFTFAALAVVSLTTGCSNEEIVNEASTTEGVTMLSASMPLGNDTRLAYEENASSMNIMWAGSETFSVYSLKESAWTNVTATQVGAEQSASADFTLSEAVSGILQAVYPAQVATPQNNSLSLSLVGQKGTKESLKDYHYMTATGAVDASATSTASTSSIKFKHQVAILKLSGLKIDGVTGTATAKKVGLSATGLYAWATLTLPTDATEPTLSPSLLGDVTTANDAEISVSGGTLADVYLAVFPGALSSAKIIARIDSKTYTYALKDVAIEAGKVYNLSGKTLKLDESWDDLVIVDGVAIISSASNLSKFVEKVNAGESNLNAKLDKDIDMTGIDFTPITNYSGSFDGNSKKISNLKISNSEATEGVAMFSKVAGNESMAEIKNLTLVNPNILGNTNVAGIVAYASKASIVSCSIVGGKVSGNETVGGIVGLGTKSTIVLGCSNVGTEVSAVGTKVAGGIAGMLKNLGNGYIAGCFNTGSVSAPLRAGGILGYCYLAKTDNPICLISACYNKGTISATPNGSSAGGIIGEFGTNNGPVMNVISCYNTGSIAGDASVGAILGKESKKLTLSTCFYSNGDNTFDGAEHVDNFAVLNAKLNDMNSAISAKGIKFKYVEVANDFPKLEQTE